MALWDLENSDVITIMGSNMAENHPIAFRFVVEAKRRGATVIHVDPRFTRTSALADFHAPIRSGSDIAFLGGIIRHIIENDLWFREWAMAYSNIAHIIEEGFVDSEDNDGIFSGFDPDALGAKPARYVGRGRFRDPDAELEALETERAATKQREGSYTKEGGAVL